MSKLFDVSGHSILVTGASSAGLGRHFATMLAEAGATVVVAARREEALQKLVGEIDQQGGKAHAVRMDVADIGSVKQGVARAAELTGGLTGLVNNSGVSGRTKMLEETEEDWDRVLDTNLKGVWAVGLEVAKHMIERGQPGSIVNIASILGLRQAAGVTSYAVSKAGVIQLTRQMALEWARYGIRINALAPGYFETDINRDFVNSDVGKEMIMRVPMRRVGRYHELSGPLLLLLSEAGSYMSGAVISVDGGHYVTSI